MSVSEMRRQRRAKLAAKKAETIVQEATEKVVVARVTGRRRVPPNVNIPEADEPAPSRPAPSQDHAAECKRLRDSENMAWWLIGQRLKLAGEASTASDPEAKRGAGAARRLYAAANRGVVPRSHAPRKGSTPKPTHAGAAGTLTDRKTMLVTQGHVIPRDMPDEEVEALLVGRTIHWAIDMALLTGTDPDTWGPEDKRWVEQDAKVHVLPENVWVGELEGTEGRVVKFREYAGFDTDRQRHMSGPTKVVRVDSIFTVR